VIEIIITDKQPWEVIDIVQELRSAGLQQGHDFDFAYYKERWDNFSHEPVVEQHTVFSFYQEELASWFTLKYQAK
jgi:hypothetical protein